MTTARPKPTSKALLLLPIPLIILCILYFPTLFPQLTPNSLKSETTDSVTITNHPHGHISDLLHAQHLSHAAFHNNLTKVYLADLISHHTREKSVVIIGYAFGGEAKLLTEYNVQAIEPMPHYIQKFKEKGPAHVTLHPYAAGKEKGILKVRYDGISVNVNMTRADAVLPKGISPVVVSADTQGSEFDALQGLGEILDRTGSVWVELGCRSNTEEMLRWLDKRFQLFDFVPWGRRPGVEENFVEESFALGERPSEIGDWVRWFCERTDEFQWLQTDVLGVRRDLVGVTWQGLSEIGERCCEYRCPLKDIMENGR